MGDDRACGDDCALSDRYARDHHGTASEPSRGSHSHVAFVLSLLRDGDPTITEFVVRGGDEHLGAKQRVRLDHDSPSIGPGPQPAPLTHATARADADKPAVANRDVRGDMHSSTDLHLPSRLDVRIVVVVEQAREMGPDPRIQGRPGRIEGPQDDDPELTDTREEPKLTQLTDGVRPRMEAECPGAHLFFAHASVPGWQGMASRYILCIRLYSDWSLREAASTLMPHIMG